jgi:hypothetical protein
VTRCPMCGDLVDLEQSQVHAHECAQRLISVRASQSPYAD